MALIPRVKSSDAGYADSYAEVMQRVGEAGPAALRTRSPRAGKPAQAAQYLLPLAYRKRTLFKMDFAEVVYISELRTGVGGHWSYRSVAYQMYERVAEALSRAGQVLPGHGHTPAGGLAAKVRMGHREVATLERAAHTSESEATFFGFICLGVLLFVRLCSPMLSLRQHIFGCGAAEFPPLKIQSSPRRLKAAGKECFMAEDRSRAIDLALAQIEKQFGKGSIMRLGSKGPIVPIAVISTGSISFDAALGVGGVPRGRVVEVFGPESSGKTTIYLQIIAEAQKAGGMAAFVDAEHALDPAYAKRLGVDVDNLLVSQPDYGEQALEITEALVRSGAIDVLVVDSVAALVPKAELDGEMGDSHMGLQARLMSQALRKLTGTVSKSRTCLIFINQIREKIGVMFGNPETTTGGRALKFYSSVRIDIRRIAAIKDGDQVVGSRTKVKIVKNKTAAPFREAEFDIMYGEGISREGDMLDVAVERNIVEKSGAWYSFDGERIGQGRENTKNFLKENKDISARIELAVRKALGLDRAAAEAPADPLPVSPKEVAAAKAAMPKK